MSNLLISDKQIKRIRDHALAWSDYYVVDMCNVALAPFETANADGSDLIGPCGGPILRSEARAFLAEYYNSQARAYLEYYGDA